MAYTTQSPTSQNLGRKALILYSICALAVYIVALGYCFLTSHFFEMYLVSAVVAVLAVFVTVLYRSMGNPKRT